MEPVNKRLILATVLLVAATSFAGTWIASPGKGSHASAAGFTASSATWDGANDRMNFSGSAVILSGAGKQLTVSFWVNTDTTASTAYIIQGRNAAGGSQWRISVSDRIAFLAQNSVPSTILQGFSNIAITAGAWRHVLFSVDMSDSGKRHLYVDGVNQASDWTTYTNDNLALDRDSIYIGADDGFGGDFAGCISELWVDDTYIDFSVSGNRDKFASGGHPISLGTTGQTPTGSSPDLYMRFVSGSLGVNSGGDGGTATITGEVTNGDCGTP